MYERNLERENQLNKCLVRRNRRILGTFLDNWKIKLLSNQATRHFNVKLLGTFFSEWHVFASGMYVFGIFIHPPLTFALRLCKIFIRISILGSNYSDLWTESKQRRVNCAVYQRALEQRTVKSYFKYWNSLTQVQNDIKKHCDLKLQIRYSAHCDS